jgi:hypothetical protein
LVITVLPTPPSITSALAATGTNGSAFSYQIAASNSPTSFNATGLPTGLSVSTSSGAITGTPSATGTTNVTISATNAGGTGSATLVITVVTATGSAPVITSPLTATGTNGSAFSYQIAASNSPTSFNAAGLPAGLSVDTNLGTITGTPSATGTSNVTLSAINASGTGTANLVLTVLAGGSDSNLAVGCAVLASSTQAGNLATYANDGNTTTTRWAASAATYPQWWRVDLGSNRSISSLTSYWYSSATRAYKYTIDVSTDDVNYTTVVNNSNNSTYGNTTDTFTATARYVRVTVTGCTAGGAYASSYEFQVYGH